MAVWNNIPTSELVGALRLDAEFWQPKYVENEHLIRSGSHAPLGSLVSVFKKGIFYILAREYVSNGIAFYRSSNVGAILPKDKNLAFITEAKHREEHKTALTRGDLIIVKTGKSGASVVLREQCNASQDVIATKVRTDRVNPFYLAAYLNTRLGSNEMNRWFQGQVQPHLSLNDARKIWVALVPDTEQIQIEHLVVSSAVAFAQGHEAWKSAQQLLESELRLDNLSFQKTVGYMARFSEIEQSRRFDPERYRPAFKNLLKHLPPEIKVSPLSSHLSFCQRGKQPNYAKQGLPVINSKHVQPNRVILEGNRRAAANPISDLQIRFGDVLLNGTGRGTIGRAAPYLQQSEAVPDNHVTILRSPDLDPVFISLYLNSIAGQLQVEMHQRGTSGQIELYPFDIRRFLIWDAPEGLQKELRSLYDQAAAAERTSKELLEEAKTRVEQLIEEAVKS